MGLEHVAVLLPPRRVEARTLQKPVAGLADEGEAHGSFRHGQLAVFIPRGRPSELPQLLGDGEEQRHGHQAGGQGGQRRDEVETVEQHDDGEPGGLSGALEDFQKRVKVALKCRQTLYQ